MELQAPCVMHHARQVQRAGAAGLDGILSPAQVAEAVVQGLKEESFLILPHEQVAQYHQNKAHNYDRWIGGMRKLRRGMPPPTLP